MVGNVPLGSHLSELGHVSLLSPRKAPGWGWGCDGGRNTHGLGILGPSASTERPPGSEGTLLLPLLPAAINLSGP